MYALQSESRTPSAQVQVESGVLPGGGAVFKGVPSTAAPIGDLRWRSPAPVRAWNSVRKEAEYGGVCLQPDQGWNSSLIATASEDCLCKKGPVLHLQPALPRRQSSSSR